MENKELSISLEKEKKDLSLKNQGKILEEINSLKKEFISKIKYDEQKEKTITKLHDELQLYKRDLYKKMLLPIINDLISFTNRSEKDLLFLKDAPAEKLLERSHDFLEDLRDILDRQGVEAYKLESDDFDPKKQKIVKTIETNDKNLDKKIANHRLFGYQWEEKIIKHEMVDIYVYVEAQKLEPDENNNTEETPEAIPTPPNTGSAPLQGGEFNETKTDSITSVGEGAPAYPETKEENNE